jgi:hypothetical protein
MLYFFFPLVLQPPWALASAFQFHDYFTDGRTPWTSDQLVARPLPKHRTTQTQNKHIHTPNIHALCGIWTHDPSFRVSEDSSCPNPRGHCDRQSGRYLTKMSEKAANSILYFECRGSRFIRNIGKYLSEYTVPHHKAARTTYLSIQQKRFVKKTYLVMYRRTAPC